MDQKCIHALGTALGPKRGPPMNAQICTLSVTGEMESEGPDEPLEGIKKAKSGTRIKVLEVLDGYYNRGPIKLPPWTEPTKKWFWGDFWGFGV